MGGGKYLLINKLRYRRSVDILYPGSDIFVSFAFLYRRLIFLSKIALKDENGTLKPNIPFINFNFFIMKKIMCVAAMLLFVSVGAVMAQVKTTNTSIVGIWQEVRKQNVDGVELMIPLSKYKILNKDGSFCNFFPEKMGYISHEGTFEVKSESALVETVESSSFSEYIGRKSELKYQLTDNGNLLRIEWQLPGDGSWVGETWRKVGMLGSAE